MIARRGILAGLGALFAAPAIVPVTSLMPVKVMYAAPFLLNEWQITREAVEMFKNSNSFVQHINADYKSDFVFMDGSQWEGPAPLLLRQREINAAHEWSAPTAVVLGAAAVVAKNPEVSRRFWGA